MNIEDTSNDISTPVDQTDGHRLGWRTDGKKAGSPAGLQREMECAIVKRKRKRQELNPQPPGVAIWIARNADSGKGLGYLVTQGKQLLSFVRCPGERGLKLAHAVAADPSRMIAPASQIRKAGDASSEEIRIDDLRHVTIEGEYISPPVFLLNCYFFRAGGSGNAAKRPIGFHAMSISLSRENGVTRLRLGWHKWLEAEFAPAWLKIAGVGKAKTAKPRIRVSSRILGGKSVEADRCKAA